VSPYFQMWQN